MYFTNRIEAGKKLADKLEKYKNKAVIYALPRGGVETGIEIAKILGCPLDLIIARKIGHPYDPEYAVCAVTETGPLICDEYEQSNLDKNWLQKAEQAERAEATRRRQTYLAGRQSQDAKGKIAIVVDDGIATGLTMRAAVAEIKKQNPSKIVVAVPVAPNDVAKELTRQVDEFIALDIPQFYEGSVGTYYQDFPQLTDERVINLLNQLP